MRRPTVSSALTALLLLGSVSALAPHVGGVVVRSEPENAARRQADVPIEARAGDAENALQERDPMVCTVTSVQSITAAVTPSPGPPTGATAVALSPQYETNLNNAIALNTAYSTQSNLSSIPCKPGNITCASGSVGLCGPWGVFDFKPCNDNKSCFAMPEPSIPGVSVGCVSLIEAQNTLGGPVAAADNGGGAPGGLATLVPTTSSGTIIVNVPLTGGVFSFLTSFPAPAATGAALAVNPVVRWVQESH